MTRPIRTALHIAADRTGSGTMRMHQPARILGSRPDLGWTVRSPREITISDYDTADLALAQRFCSPDGWRFWEAAIQHPRCVAVYEADDLFLHNEKTNREAWEWFARPEVRATAIRAMRESKAIIVSSVPLAEELAEFNGQIHVIPNYIDADLVLDTPPAPRPDRPVVIGWAGGDSHDLDVATIQAPLTRLLRRQRRTVELHIMGMDYRWVYGGRDQRFTPWKDSVDDYVTCLDFDIGLCPLLDTRFGRCKTALKALEYAARGIPVLAPDLTPYREVVEHGVWGYRYRDAGEFTDYCNELIHDPDLRLRMGTEGIGYARANTEQGNIGKRAAIYDALVS